MVQIYIQHKKALEENFPFIEVSKIGERESYRKEIFRPIYHIHKWWANRLGSVFRAISLSAISNSDVDIWKMFYKKNNLSGKIIFDPFMGSGTTLGETAKLGAKPIGCDINPVSTFAVKQALTRVDIEKLESEFNKLNRDISDEIKSYYRTLDPTENEHIPVLYYFWVKLLEMPSGEVIPLFSSYVFSKNAYPKRKPEAKIICPNCWNINTSRYDSKELVCQFCSEPFNPQIGPAKGQYVMDSKGNRFRIKELLPTKGEPLKHRLYAMMALRENGEKLYLTPNEFDFELYKKAASRLTHEDLPLPNMEVRPGHNTNQARSYNYKSWKDFFNERQLLCLGLLLKRILAIDEEDIREQFLCLFSSTLEFNNLFCTFKGEGTGAVRHMFSHHILKPERVPLENSIWGTEKSSGTFATLYKSRLLKAKRYLDNPTEILLTQSQNGKSTLKSSYVEASNPIKLKITDTWEEFSKEKRSALIMNGDSASVDIPDKSVDAVVTDPPYFDFIHYSELSDFFFAWLAPVLCKKYTYFSGRSSFNEGEVQNKNPFLFAEKLSRVFKECHRVLKDEGILAFTFHHSRIEGWASIYSALINSDFDVVAAYPVHAEMKVASPKSSNSDPISLDMILVCRKHDAKRPGLDQKFLQRRANSFVKQLTSASITPSKADIFNIYASLALIHATKQNMSVENYKTDLVPRKWTVNLESNGLL